jgi:hypothetical protein
MINEPEASSQPTPIKRYTAHSVIVIIVAILVIVGIILIWVGQLVLVTANVQTTATMREAYRNSRILTIVGAMISSAALFGGALAAENIDKFVRLGMIIAATLIVLGVLAFGATYPYGYY